MAYLESMSSPIKSINGNLVLAGFSVLFGWFFGLPALAAGIVAFRSVKTQTADKNVKKRKWLHRLSITGIAFSSLFTLYYLLALFTGAFIHNS
jgi:hypothetical protein